MELAVGEVRPLEVAARGEHLGLHAHRLCGHAGEVALGTDGHTSVECRLGVADPIHLEQDLRMGELELGP